MSQWKPDTITYRYLQQVPGLRSLTAKDDMSDPLTQDRQISAKLGNLDRKMARLEHLKSFRSNPQIE